MVFSIFSRKAREKREPMFTPEDYSNIAWFWRNYLRSRAMLLVVVLGLILMQGFVYQQFLRLTENGLRVIFENGQPGELFRVCAIVFGLFTVRGLTSYVVPRMSTWLSSSAVMELRQHMIHKMMTFDLAYFDKTSPGSTILRMVNQAQRLSTFVGQTTVNAVRDTVTILIVSSYLIYQAPLLFAIVIIVAPVIAVLLQFVSAGIKKVQANSEGAIGTYMNTLEETMSGMRTVKIAHQEPVETERLMASAREIKSHQIRLQSAQAVVLPAIDIASAFAYALVIGFGGYMAIDPSNDLDGAAIITFLLGLVLIFDPMRSLAGFFAQLQARLVLLRSIREFMNIEPQIVDREGATDTVDTSGDLRLEGVSFAYSEKSPLFENLDMTFAAGRSTAIVGATGSGKTTILSLLARLYEVQSGRITLSDVDIRDIKIAALRESFSVVAQDIVIFNASIFENIRYVRPDATEEEVWAAAEAAEIADLMRARGGGKTGPKGAQLSGGQKQRIAIARAFLRDAPILLLDEATSALDQRTEEKVKRALARLSRGKTTVIVAHRLSAIADADHIYVLDEGRVVEDGTHDQLLALGGLYAGMYSTQKEAYR